MTTTSNIHSIAATIERHGEFAHGGESADEVAAGWAENGFDAEQTAAWLDARCFDADAAAKLRDAGITPEQATEHTTAGLGEYADTAGYKVANGDLAVADVDRAVIEAAERQ